MERFPSAEGNPGGINGYESGKTDTSAMGRRYPNSRRAKRGGHSWHPHPHRGRELGFGSQLAVGCILVAAVTWIATPQVTALWTSTTSSPEKNAERERSVYYSGCNEARAAGAAPMYRGQPGYRPGMDGDDDGIACEGY